MNKKLEIKKIQILKGLKGLEVKSVVFLHDCDDSVKVKLFNDGINRQYVDKILKSFGIKYVSYSVVK